MSDGRLCRTCGQRYWQIPCENCDQKYLSECRTAHHDGTVYPVAPESVAPYIKSHLTQAERAYLHSPFYQELTQPMFNYLDKHLGHEEDV